MQASLVRLFCFKINGLVVIILTLENVGIFLQSVKVFVFRPIVNIIKQSTSFQFLKWYQYVAANKNSFLIKVKQLIDQI